MLPLLLLLSGVAQAEDPPPDAPSGVGLPASQQKKLFKQWGCDADTTTVALVGSEPVSGFEVTGWLVTGCGEPFVQTMNERRGQWTFGPDDRELRKRAPFDLSCGAADVTYTWISSTTRGASGCGQQLTYIRIDQKWVANVAGR